MLVYPSMQNTEETIGEIYMKDVECVESKKKSCLLFFELWSFFTQNIPIFMTTLKIKI